MHKLFITHRSPYARKVRIALLEKKIPFEEISIDLFCKPKSFLKKNPLGTIPSLISQEGLVLPDSTLILYYLEKHYPQPPLTPQTPSTAWEAWKWEELSDRLCEQKVNAFFEKQRSDQRQSVFDKAEKTLTLLLHQLCIALENKDYILGDFSIADIAVGSTLLWMNFRLGYDFSKGSPWLTQWVSRLNARESFQQTLPRLEESTPISNK